MEANTKKRIIIWTSVAAIVGVGGYFLYKYLKDKGIIGKKDTGDTGSTGGQNTGGGAENQVVQPIASSTPTAEQTALATAYRIWANSTDELSKKYGKKSQYDLDATRSNPYGGTFLQSYAAGKTEYEASLKGVSATLSDSLISDIATIRSKANVNSPNAAESYLKSVASKYPSYVQNWANALRNNATTFLFANQIYESNNGIRVYNSNPFLASEWYASGGQILKANPTNNSAAYSVAKNTSLGKVKATKYTNEGLWFYLPDKSSVYKWTKADWVKSSKY
jgi:hypothetical protein